MQQRLQKILSQAGVASRRAAETLIAEGRVSVNGSTVHELGTKADADQDDIRVDGRRLHGAEVKRYILLNKPAGFVSTAVGPAAPPDRDRSAARRARVRLPGRPARLRHRGPAAADQRRRPGGEAHPSPARRRAHLSRRRGGHARRGALRRDCAKAFRSTACARCPPRSR